MSAYFATLEHQLRKHLNRKTKHLNTMPGKWSSPPKKKSH